MSFDRSLAPIEVRSAAVADVKFSERRVDLLAVPYCEPAIVEHPPGSGRLVEEQFARGAFSHYGYEPRRRLLALLEHDRGRIVGRVERIDPFRPEGLGSTLRIRRSEEGDQALLDAEDGFLGGSIAFAVPADGERWESRSRRWILRAHLDHISLVWVAAYAGAKVLNVRTRPSSPTPNLDTVLASR